MASGKTAKVVMACTTCIAVLLLCACSEDGGGNPVTGTGDKGSSSKVTCSDFSSQSAAQAAYNSGNPQLDGDNDGVACESLK